MPEFLQQLTDIEAALPSLRMLIFYLLLSFVLSKPIAWVYIWTHLGTSYSRSFVHALVMLSMIVSFVMLAIGDSMARAFGLFGALALIRFRTPIKDSRDTVFLFLSVAVGIAVGVQNAMLAVAGTSVALLVAVYMFSVRFGERIDSDAVIRFTQDQDTSDDGDPLLRKMLRHYCKTFALISMRDGRKSSTLDLSYQIMLREPGCHRALVNDMHQVPGIHSVNLLMTNEHEEV
jgi:uncharacterized membrane protein YhiD involved in acid resistance